MFFPPPLPTAQRTLLASASPAMPVAELARDAPRAIPSPPSAAEPVLATPADEPAIEPVPWEESAREDWHDVTSMAVSTAVHVVALLILALMVPHADDRVAVIQIVSSLEDDANDFLEQDMLPVEMPLEPLEDLDVPMPDIPMDVVAIQAADIAPMGVLDLSDTPTFAGPLPESLAGESFLLATTGAVRAGGGTGGGGGFGGELGRRLALAGAQSGVIQVSLAWNNFNDLDLHVVAPSGERIYFNRRRSRCGGHLDVDMNAGGPASREPVENVFWSRRIAPVGTFQVFVDLFQKHDAYDKTPFEVSVLVDGVASSYKGVVSDTARSVMVTEFQRKRGGGASASDDEFVE